MRIKFGSIQKKNNIIYLKRQCPADKTIVSLIKRVNHLSQEELDQIIQADEYGVYYKLKEKMLFIGQEAQVEHYEVKEGTKIMDSGALYHNRSMHELVIPASVKEIRASALPKAMNTISFKGKKLTISPYAFGRNQNLQTIVVPKGCIDSYKQMFETIEGPLKAKIKKGKLQWLESEAEKTRTASKKK